MEGHDDQNGRTLATIASRWARFISIIWTRSTTTATPRLHVTTLPLPTEPTLAANTSRWGFSIRFFFLFVFDDNRARDALVRLFLYTLLTIFLHIVPLHCLQPVAGRRQGKAMSATAKGEAGRTGPVLRSFLYYISSSL
jgi:hypothetical protein